MKRGEGGEIKIKVISEPGNPSGAKAESEGQPGERGLLHKITKILLQFLFFQKKEKEKKQKKKKEKRLGKAQSQYLFLYENISIKISSCILNVFKTSLNENPFGIFLLTI